MPRTAKPRKRSMTDYYLKYDTPGPGSKPKPKPKSSSSTGLLGKAYKSIVQRKAANRSSLRGK